MIKSFFLLINSIFIFLSGFSQTPSDELFEVDLRKNILNDTGSLIFYTLTDKHFIEQIKIDRRYYWFADGKVQSTYGGLSGQPLNGKYIQYYKNGALAENGEFKYGLKAGKWITWYENGHVKAIYNWKDGLLEGVFEEYSSTGKLVRKGVYKNNLLHGKLIYYNESTIVKEEKYKKGLKSTQKDTKANSIPPDTLRVK